MYIYILSIEEILDLPGVHLLPPERQKRLFRYRKTSDRARCLGAGLLIRHLLHLHHPDGAHAAFRVKTDENGKPFIPDGPHFNVTHAGRFVAAAVSESGQIGIDLEEITAFCAAIAQKCFQPQELEWLSGRRNMDQAFFTLWTGKEALMKATGLGFRLDPADFHILPVSASRHTICASPWFLKWRRINGHVLCVCAQSDEPLHMKILSREDLGGL